MGIGVSVFLIAVGAILRFAINVDVRAVDIGMIGNILMVVGVGWLVISLILLRRRRSERHVYDE